MSFRFSADDMQKLNDAQKDTIIDVVIAGVLADGQVQDAEVSVFENELRKVPWGRTENEMVDKIKASFTKISSFSKPEQAVDLVKNAVSTLSDQSIREKTFAMLARMMYADKEMSENEGTVLMVFADQFKIPMPTIQQIGAAVKKGD
jgi:uncharacterized tellurite resistance protein B-like protein